MKLTDDVCKIRGVGPGRADILRGMGLRTVADVIDFFPRTYADLSVSAPIFDLVDGENAVVRAVVTMPVKTVRVKNNMEISKFVVSDGTGELGIRLFNQRYTASSISMGKEFIFYGKVKKAGFFADMDSPQIENAANARIMPVYSATKEISRKVMRNIVTNALKDALPSVTESLTDEIIEENSLMKLPEAYSQIHSPSDNDLLARAKERFVFEELLLFSLGMSVLRGKRHKKFGIKMSEFPSGGEFFNALPYKLTQAQLRAARECVKDMRSGIPMARLIQGDVGCGKTAVAALLMYYTSKCGMQSCLMAPTEILAAQHFASLSGLLGKLGVRCSLLTGGTPARLKREILSDLSEGNTDVLIGTHAVISDGVVFRNLALTVTDEQHRFGVNQRAKLTSKGVSPHMLVMSATPIPRTLSMILYGDLDVSVIDELPPGRKKVSTFLVDSSFHDRMYSFLRETVKNGGQAYVVCPLADEGDDEDLKSAVEFASEIGTKYLFDCSVAYVHGKMPSKDKNRILEDFAAGKINVLVSTTVIEVGINVPNATVMIVENAERFGLSQLHQLRGRVGRGADKSYCFVVSDNKSEKTKERLDAFCATNDGFEISRKDLELRGPGDFFGVRQSGMPMFRHADLMRDMKTLERARIAADKILFDPLWFNDTRLATMKNAVVRLFENVDFNVFS